MNLTRPSIPRGRNSFRAWWKNGAPGGGLTNHNGHHIYGYIDVRPEYDAVAASRQHRLGGWAVRKIDDGDWTTEHDRPMYFVEVRGGYRCGWFHQEGSRLVMHPHPLSQLRPETWRTPDEAEIVGRVTGVGYASEWAGVLSSTKISRRARDSNRKDP